MRTSAYMPWYEAQFYRAYTGRTGSEFESLVSALLKEFHPGFINPQPKGSLGDHGCDGITYEADIFYACFGYLQNRNEKALERKIRSDFARAANEWDDLERWRFVTNFGAGPLATKALVELRKKHGPGSSRPIVIDFWGVDEFWREVVSKLSPQTLDRFFPGVPEAADVRLNEVVPLLEHLGAPGPAPQDTGQTINPVPPQKMDYNGISPAGRIEFQQGRGHSQRIAQWYAEQPDPTLRDRHGRGFNEIYRSAQGSGADVLESIYIALAGANFRLEQERANAAYAVTAYFFDECDIFETPPAGWCLP